MKTVHALNNDDQVVHEITSVLTPYAANVTRQLELKRARAKLYQGVDIKNCCALKCSMGLPCRYLNPFRKTRTVDECRLDECRLGEVR